MFHTGKWSILQDNISKTTGPFSKGRRSDLPGLRVLSLGGSGGRFLRRYHDIKSKKSHLITDTLETVWAIPAVCVERNSLLTSWADNWYETWGCLPPSCTLYRTPWVFILSVCVNNLWGSNFSSGALWPLNSTFCIPACSLPVPSFSLTMEALISWRNYVLCIG